MLLSRLPVPMNTGDRGAAAAWAYPLVGLILGGAAAAVGACANWLGLPSALCAIASLATLIVLTGAMHEDGLADTADGFWGGWTPEARLDIMKDSRIGTYGVLALVLATAARWAAIWLLFDQGVGAAAAALVISGAMSRATMPTLMTILPNAREKGLSQSVGATTPATAVVAWGVALLAALLLAGMPAIWAGVWAAVMTLCVAWLAKRKVGGQTGDVLGASQQLSEIAILFSLLV